jgi:hypothetical protein
VSVWLGAFDRVMWVTLACVLGGVLLVNVCEQQAEERCAAHS